MQFLLYDSYFFFDFLLFVKFYRLNMTLYHKSDII